MRRWRCRLRNLAWSLILGVEADLHDWPYPDTWTPGVRDGRVVELCTSRCLACGVQSGDWRAWYGG